MDDSLAFTRIVVAGLGGVGGYFGGLLAKHYAFNSEVEVDFLARGTHGLAIQNFGLRVLEDGGEFIAKPRIVSDEAAAFGSANLILLCSKSYDLELILSQLKPCVNPNTIFIPLLNGVNHQETVQRHYPNHIVLGGCVYIVSRLQAPGVVVKTGTVQKLFFGGTKLSISQLKRIETLLTNAGIEAVFTEDIERVIWEKYLFLSPLATATCYYDKTIHELLADFSATDNLKILLSELKQVADKKEVALLDDSIDNTFKKYLLFLPGVTTSMHHDMRAKRKTTELSTLTKYVLDEAEKLGMKLPNYEQFYNTIKLRIAAWS